MLIIEDNLEIRENTAELLELGGFNVLNAENGREGIALAIRSVPDVVLCDIAMPEVDGYQVLSELKGNPVTANIPFIYITAKGEKNEIKMAMDMGAQGYIRKPFDLKDLMQEINRFVR